jgi:hypothetical protein
MPHDKKTVAEMIGELFREAAVLVGVFIPLDMIFTNEAYTPLCTGLRSGDFGAMLRLRIGN